MSNSSLQELISGDPDLVRILRGKFPDLFTSRIRYKKRTEACIRRLMNDLERAKKASLSKLPSDFETLPELIGVPRQEDILLTPSFSLSPQEYLVLQCHTVSIGDRLLILPAEFLNPISALGKEYFIIECKSFYRNYALYKSRMVAANCCYFSNRFLPPTEVRGAGHRQSGALDLFLLPTGARLEELGEQLYQKDQEAIQKAISSNHSISVEDLCNPKPGSSSYRVLQDIDKEIERLYDFSNFPTGLNINQEQWALLKLYAQSTQLLDGLKRL